MLAAIVRTCQWPEGHWKLCEHEFANTSTHVFLNTDAHKVLRDVGLLRSSGVESGHTVILGSRCTKLLFFRSCYGWMSESNGCAVELNPMRIGRDASCDSLDAHFPKI